MIKKRDRTMRETRAAENTMGPRVHGFVASCAAGRDVYRLFRCKLWPYAIQFATPQRTKVSSDPERRAAAGPSRWVLTVYVFRLLRRFKRKITF